MNLRAFLLFPSGPRKLHTPRREEGEFVGAVLPKVGIPFGAGCGAHRDSSETSF